jgi:diguanylate cyclase (GGDEF)-like protein
VACNRLRKAQIPLVFPVINLDLPTLMAMESFVALCAGVAVLFGWWQGREARALLLWAVNCLLLSLGLLLLLLGTHTGATILFALGTLALTLGAGLAWSAVRIFCRKPAWPPVALLGVAVSIVIGMLPSLRDAPNVLASVPLIAGLGYFTAAAWTLWEDRGERLAARGPMIGLLLLHAFVLAAGAAEFLGGRGVAQELAPLGSIFGIVHFETIIFAVGTAAFFLAMVRERTELTSRRAAHTDGLTGVANRRSFMEGAERALNRCRRDDAPMALVMFDLDRFKGINDGHGHSTGDLVIQHFARVVRDAMRPTDLFGRIGGEEFCMALPGADIDAAFARADRIRMEFGRATFPAGEEILTATVSAGVAADAGGTLTMLLADADAALYRAKADGRNRVAKSTADKGRAVLRIA